MAVLTREFALDPAILGKGSAASVSVSSGTNAATLAAIAANTPFPSAVDLGHVSLSAGTGQGIAFAAGSGSVTFKAAATIESGVGIFDSSKAALDSLGLDAANAIDLKLAAAAGSRWALMRWGYDISGTVSGSHPLGVIGAATLGIDAKSDAAFAVLHRFDTASGARDVLAATVSSWRLPRHVNLAGADVNIAPLTWIIAEADGSLALTLAAKLGYDVSFTHESKILGLTRDLSARIDANLKATLGISVSGRYLIVIGREDVDPASHLVRLRLYKQSKQGLAFGLNLNVGVKATSPLPRSFDDFVQAVFGVHGPQVVKDLHVIEEWTDPSRDLGETAARLTTTAGIDLLRRATGFDLPARFHEARKVVVDALARWNRLPDRVSALLWTVLSKATPADAVDALRKFLGAVSGPDFARRREALIAALQAAPVSDSAVAAWLQAIAERGLLALMNELDRVSSIAGDALAILDGGVIANIQQFVTTKLDLGPLRKAVTDDDFKAIDEWLVKRLADLLNRPELHLQDLKQVQQAIFAVDTKVRAIYDQAITAMTKRYSAELASTYEQSRGDTALVDVLFDLGVAEGLTRFRAVTGDSQIDDLLLHPADGVRLNQATLTHAIRQKTDVEVRLPFVTTDTTDVTDSLAKLSVEEHAGRVLLYEFDATDTRTTANRARSELSVLGSLRMAAADGSAPVTSGTIAYESRQVQRGAKSEDLERRARPFIDAYLDSLFPNGDPSLRAFYADVAAGVLATSPGDRDRLGDVALSSEVSYPADVLQGWLLPRDEGAVTRDSMRLSRAVQASIKRLLPDTYFDDIDHLRAMDPVAALLLWASFPISTSIDIKASPIQFNTDGDVFWDYTNAAERNAIARDRHTIVALQKRLGGAQARLRDAGRRDADEFAPANAGRFIQLAQQHGGDVFLSSLLNAEALMIGGAVSALRSIADAVRQTRTAPAAAVRALSEFAATLVQTFSSRLQFVYSQEAARVLGAMMLAEASAAINPAYQTTPPTAALRLYVFKAVHAFTLDQFLKGALPPADNVAITETLVRA